MPEVKLIMQADNSDHLRKIKEVQEAHRSLNKTVVDNQKREKGLIEEIEAQLTDLTIAKRKAYTSEDIAKYNREIEKAKNQLNQLNNAGGKVENTTKGIGLSMGKLAGVIGVITTAIAFFKSVLESTGKSADKFSFAIQGIKQGFDAVKRSIATLDFKEFGRKVKEAFEEGRRYAESIDLIEEKTRALRIEEKMLGNEILRLRSIQNDATIAQQKRNEAGAKAVEIEEKLAGIRTQIAQEAYENEIMNIMQITGLTQNQILAYVRRDEQFINGIETGKKYRKSVEDITEEEKEWVRIANAIVLPTDKQYEKLTQSIVNLEEARGSALENTLRIRSKLSSGIEKENKESDKVIKQTKKDLTELQDISSELIDKSLKGWEDLVKKEKDINEFTIKLKKLFDVPEGLQGGDFYKEQEKGLNEFNKNRIEQDQKAEDTRLAARRQSWETIIAGEQAVFDILAYNADAQLNQELANLDKWTQAQLKAAGDDEKKKQKILEISEAEKLKIEKKYRKEQQNISVAQTVINGAQAIVKTFAEYGYTPPGWVAAGLMAALTALQVGVIKSQKFAKGGWTGKGGQVDETGQRMAGIVHEEEFVTRKGPAAKYRELLEAINRDDKRAMLKSFNKVDIPDINVPAVNNSIRIDNNGPNSRLDRIAKEQQKLNDQISRQQYISHTGGRTIITRGNKTRVMI